MKTQPTRFTALGIPKLTKGRHTDGTGLYMAVGVNRRTWYTVGRGIGEQRLGHWPAMGIAEAREELAAVLKRKEAGLPPIPSARPKLLDSHVFTLGAAIDAYEKMRRAKGGKGTKSLDAALRTVRTNLGMHLSLPVRQFTKADLRSVRDQIHKRAPQQASRFLAYCGPVWRWMAQEDIVETNIVPDVLKIASIQKRTRTLSHDEIAAIWHASVRLGKGVTSERFGAMVRFLLLCAQRRGEAASMRHGDVLDRVWRLKAEATKANRAHRLNLPQLALDQIGSGAAQDRCFPGKGGTEMSGFSKLKAELDRLSGVSDWVLHDLRRTASSELQELSVDHMVIESILNHAVVGVAGHYMHASLDKAKATALEKWADEVERITGSKRAAS